MKFVKMHGAGNDYVYVDCFRQKIEDPQKLAIEVSDRNFGIGGDGFEFLDDGLDGTLCVASLLPEWVEAERAEFALEWTASRGQHGVECVPA